MQKIKNFLSKLELFTTNKDKSNVIYYTETLKWMDKEDDGRGVLLDLFYEALNAYQQLATVYHGTILTRKINTSNTSNNEFSFVIQFTSRKDCRNFKEAAQTIIAFSKLATTHTDATLSLVKIFTHYKWTKYD